MSNLRGQATAVRRFLDPVSTINLPLRLGGGFLCHLHEEVHAMDSSFYRRWATRPRLLPAIALIVVLLFAACTGGDAATAMPTEKPTAESVIIVDSDGFELTFEVAPTRIISLSPGTTEILFAIGAWDQVVAVDEWANFPSETEKLERVKYIDPDPERVLSLNPDLVLMATAQQPQVKQFRSLGLTVLFNLEPDSIEGVLENILLLGLVTGHTEEAETLVAQMKIRIAIVEEAIAAIDQGPRVFYELSSDLYTVAPNTFIGSTLTLLKAQNVAQGAEMAFPQLTAEALIAANPEVVLLADHVWGESLETVAVRPGWDAVDAVINERVYGVDPDTGNRPSQRIVESIEEIASLLYPDLFE
jgi:iron complex transport system substrate-binding protein